VISRVSLLTELPQLNPTSGPLPSSRREQPGRAGSVHRPANGLSLPTNTEILNSMSTPQAMQQVARQHGAGIDVEHLPDAVLRVVVEELVDPLQHVIVGLADPTEVAGGGGRAAEVDVRASVPFVSSVSTTLAPMICYFATATAGDRRRPSSLLSSAVTRSSGPGMRERSAMAFRAAPR